MGDKQLICAFCKHQKHDCVHVEQVLSATQAEDIPKVLLPIAEQLNSTACGAQPRKRYGVQSTKRIPYIFDVHLQNTLKQPVSDRFDFKDGVCHLREDQNTQCSKCGHNKWSEDEKKVIIVTHNVTLPAIGTFIRE